VADRVKRRGGRCYKRQNRKETIYKRHAGEEGITECVPKAQQRRMTKPKYCNDVRERQKRTASMDNVADHRGVCR